jgi:ABC-type sugar transport system, periplasmic component
MNKAMKLASSVAVIATALSLTACGTGPNGSQAADNTSGSLTSTVIISTLNNPFFVSVAAGAKAQAAKSGMKLDVQNANNSDQTSLDQATTALTKQPSVMIIDPVGSDSGGAITRQANQAKVPVVAFDRMPSSGDLASFIGYDAIKAGNNAAESLAKALNGTGTVVEIQGILGTNVAQDRSKGFNQGIAKFPGIKVVAVQSADFDRGKALNVMTNILQAHSDINGVYAANDEMAMGVIAALQARNLAGTVKVVGNDGIADALKAIDAGTMYSTNAESPFVLGQEVVSLAVKVAKGESVEKNTVLTGRLVTKADVPDFCAFLKDAGDADTCADVK